jgi:hypothetical protein
MQFNLSMHQVNMRYTIILLIAFLGIASFAQAQSGVKLYGYVQSVTQGVAGKQLDENGKVVKKTPAKLHNYFMYLTSTSKNRMYPVEIWIKGERLGVKAEAVSTTPVTTVVDDGSMNAKTIVLVPETTSKVWLLTGTREPLLKKFPKAKTLAEKNELVVVYRLNGKFGYATLKEFQQLSSGAMQ